jgi:hypothetical protein
VTEQVKESMDCKDLGLAAYIKKSGVDLVACEGRVYRFACGEQRYRELELQYANSCCRAHDALVMYLRTLQRC